MAKLNFQQPLLKSSVSQKSFRNDCNMLILVLKKHFLLSMMKTVVCDLIVIQSLSYGTPTCWPFWSPWQCVASLWWP